jgi:hypothetical protein
VCVCVLARALARAMQLDQEEVKVTYALLLPKAKGKLLKGLSLHTSAVQEVPCSMSLYVNCFHALY